MAEKVKGEVVTADEENNIRALANFKSRDVKETQKVKKSLKVIMNKVSLVKMATFLEATKELNLVTIPNIQLLVSAIIDAAYETDRAEIFATFCKELSRDTQPFRRQLLQSLQKDFKLGLSVEEGRRRREVA